MAIKKTRTIKFGFLIEVGLLGLEPRLFYTKNRRVASYTIGQHFNSGANLEQTLFYANIFRFFYYLIFQALKPVFFLQKSYGFKHSFKFIPINILKFAN